jgi:hypothetical protein
VKLAAATYGSLAAATAASAVLGAGVAAADVPALTTPYLDPADHYAVLLPAPPQVRQVPTTASDGSRITVDVVTGIAPDQSSAFSVSTTRLGNRRANLDAGVDGLLRKVDRPSAVVRSAGSFQGHPSRTVSFNSAQYAQKVVTFIANGESYSLLVIAPDTADADAAFAAFTAVFRLI